MSRSICLVLSALLSFCTVNLVHAQSETSSQNSTSIVTATATTERVRFTTPPSVVQMRIEVLTDTGETLFDVKVKGNVFDWHLQDGQAERVANGTYLCVVTAKEISGKLAERIGKISVADRQIAIEPAQSSQLSPRQTQAIGPLEADASLTVLRQDNPQTTTVIANTGEEGQIVRGQGALSFRLGDFYSGKDQEQMRLTEDGNLGIGTAKPEFKLDVAGAIRAREGFVFDNGSTLNVSDKGVLTLTNSNGDITPNATGTGTQNRLAKWAETGGTGTLTDSAVVESGGNVGIGTASPSGKLHLHAGVGQAADVRMTNDSISSPFNFGGALPNNLGARFTFATVNEGGLAAQGFTDGNSPAFRFQGHIGTTTPTQIPVIFEGFKSNGAGDRAPLGPTEKAFGFYNGAFDGGGTVLMALRGDGNVGIGTTAPGSKLDVFDGVVTSSGPGGGRFVSRNPNNQSALVQLDWFNDGTHDWPRIRYGGANEGAANGLLIQGPGDATKLAVLNNGNVGIGTAAPVSRLDAIANGTQIHFGDTADDTGGYLSSVTASQAILAGGARFDGTQWIAKSISASLVDNISGTIKFFTNIGLSAGSTFSPTERMVITAAGDVGIGITSPNAKLHVQGGDIYVGSAGSGIILKSPNGNVCRQLTINDSGGLISFAVTCP